MNMWQTRKQLAETLGCSQSQAGNIFRDVGKLVGIRYQRYVLAGSRISYIAVIDFLTYGKQLNDKNMSKTVPDFDPEKIKELMI